MRFAVLSSLNTQLKAETNWIDKIQLVNLYLQDFVGFLQFLGVKAGVFPFHGVSLPCILCMLRYKP